jgi:hypothetical protein
MFATIERSKPMVVKNKNLRTLNTLINQSVPNLPGVKDYALTTLAMEVNKQLAIYNGTLNKIVKNFYSENSRLPDKIDPQRVSEYNSTVEVILEMDITLPELKLTYNESKGFQLTFSQKAELIELGIIEELKNEE